MSNLRSQITDSEGISVTASIGTKSAVTRLEMTAAYIGAVGTPAQKRAAVIAFVKDELHQDLGTPLIDPAGITFDFFATDWTDADIVLAPINLEII